MTEILRYPEHPARRRRSAVAATRLAAIPPAARTTAALPATVLLAATLLAGALLAAALPAGAHAQVVDADPRSTAGTVIADPDGIVAIGRGKSALIVHPVPLERVTVGDPEIAEAVIVSPNEIVVNGKSLGGTSLFVWDEDGGRALYTVEVAVDADALRRRVRELFPDQEIRIDAAGGQVFLSGEVRNPAVAEQIRALVRALGAEVLNDALQAGERQVLLEVKFAEVSRSAIESLGTNEVRALEFGDATADEVSIQSLSDGLVRLLLLGEDVSLDLLIRALRERSIFRTLAEPNLLVLAGEQASFLAGGEFPFPVVQGNSRDAVTIQFKEFGVRLRFRPVITEDGAIRLEVAPEVSSLDFANGLSFSGFRVPALRTRRAHTHVELRPGQHLAIAGLLNHTLDRTRSRVPVLGDIPIIGTFFRSEDDRQSRTELLVIVTPRLVEATDEPPELPVPDPSQWDWEEWLNGLDLPESHR